MATINLTVNPDITGILLIEYPVELAENSCSSLWNIKIINTNKGDVIKINVIGSFSLFDVNDPSYILNTNYTTTVDEKNNIIIMQIENSGTSGIFLSATISIDNITTGASDSRDFTRFNDSPPC